MRDFYLVFIFSCLVSRVVNYYFASGDRVCMCVCVCAILRSNAAAAAASNATAISRSVVESIEAYKLTLR